MNPIPITKDILLQMQDILNCSAGYEVSLEDEIEYFDPQGAAMWRAARDANGQWLGFVRSFKRSPEWSQAEFFVRSTVENRKEVAVSLLSSFKKASKFPSGHRHAEAGECRVGGARLPCLPQRDQLHPGASAAFSC